MIILGIETSCDETAAAVISTQDNSIKILSNIVSSQVALHQKWGGVVPNLAAREHLKNILPVITAALSKARTKPTSIDLIAVTNGPGLIPALLIGVNTAKTLSYLWNKPLIGVHHIEGHIYANFIGSQQESVSSNRKLNSCLLLADNFFPALCLVVSGGHTQLVFMKKHLHYKIIGQTLDDAAGEAFDKAARILGLNYPGGPAIAASASKAKNKKHKLLSKNLPRPMIGSPNFNFSFSGLKTAVLYLTKKNERLLKKESFVNEVSLEFQQAVVDVLITKTIAAAKKHNPKTIMLAGGVSANAELRRQLGEAIDKELKNISYIMPDTSYCIDNAAMIAAAAYWRWRNNKNKKFYAEAWKDLPVDANLSL